VIGMDPITKAFMEAKNNPKMKKKIQMKTTLTTVLIIAFIGVIFLTVGTIISAKTGHFLGMNHIQMLKLKATYGIFMLILILIHLAMNWKIYTAELKAFSKE
jgi:hypothetical protein